MSAKYVYKIVRYDNATKIGFSPYNTRKPMNFRIGKTTRRRKNDEGIYAFKSLQSAYSWEGGKNATSFSEGLVILRCTYIPLSDSELISRNMMVKLSNGKIRCAEITPVAIVHGLVINNAKIGQTGKFTAGQHNGLEMLYTQHGWVNLNQKNKGMMSFFEQNLNKLEHFVLT